MIQQQYKKKVKLGGATVYSVEDITWENHNNTGIENTDEIHKTGGVDGNFDAGANSDKSINDTTDSYFEFEMDAKATAADYRCGAGLSNDHPDDSYASIDFCWVFALAATVFENGSAKTGSISYSAGDIFKITVESGAVKYYLNDNLEYTSLNSPTTALMARFTGRDNNSYIKAGKIYDSKGLV